MTRPFIRPYRDSDMDMLHEVCVRTGAAGGDASGLVDDQRLFGELWAAPYATFEPDLAFVVDRGDGTAVGYIVGTRDAVAFEQRCEREWWPALRVRHPRVVGGERLDDLLIDLIHDRGEPRSDIHHSHPSELHIDLLPEAQGRGLGRRLVERLAGRLREVGSPGVHLGVSVANTRAVEFYRHLGFSELDSDGVTRTFVMAL